MIQKRHLGFHPPVSLPTDAIHYCDAIGKVQTPIAETTTPASHASHASKKHPVTTATDAAPEPAPVIIPGNSPAEVAKIRASATALLPLVQNILDLEAQLSKAYGDYDHNALTLWDELTTAREYAETYAEKNDAAEVHAIVGSIIYHGGRLKRHDKTPATPPATPATK